MNIKDGMFGFYGVFRMNLERKYRKLQKRIVKLKRFKRWADNKIADTEAEILILEAQHEQ